MAPSPARCLILACGNTLRGDDGVGPWLAAWAEEKYCHDPTVRVLAPQQWTPELAEDVAHAQSVLFIDCSAESAPGSMQIIEVHPSAPKQGLSTHHLDAPELLALARDLYNSLPRESLLLTVGACSTELGEEFGDAVIDALPGACMLLEETVLRFLSN